MAQRMMLASGHIDVINHYALDTQVASMSMDADGNSIESFIDQERVEVINYWDNGHVEVRGADVDYDSLEKYGIITNRHVTNSNHVINHTDINGELVIFMDDPKLHYYTNGHVQSGSNDLGYKNLY